MLAQNEQQTHHQWPYPQFYKVKVQQLKDLLSVKQVYFDRCDDQFIDSDDDEPQAVQTEIQEVITNFNLEDDLEHIRTLEETITIESWRNNNN